jgi:hypothetical protein
MHDSQVDDCSLEESGKSTVEQTPKWDESLNNNTNSNFLMKENSFSKPSDNNLL